MNCCFLLTRLNWISFVQQNQGFKIWKANKQNETGFYDLMFSHSIIKPMCWEKIGKKQHMSESQKESWEKQWCFYSFRLSNKFTQCRKKNYLKQSGFSLVGRKSLFLLTDDVCIQPTCELRWKWVEGMWKNLRKEIIFISYYVPGPDAIESFILSHVICIPYWVGISYFISTLYWGNLASERCVWSIHFFVYFGMGKVLGYGKRHKTRLHVSKTHSRFIPSYYLSKYPCYIVRSPNIRKQDQGVWTKGCHTVC